MLMDRLLDIRTDMRWVVTDICHLKDIVTIARKKFKEPTFKANWVDGMDDDTLKQVFSNYDEYRGTSQEGEK